ncbi:hypothetical protein ACLK1Z_07020 [Escherichia coli]
MLEFESMLHIAGGAWWLMAGSLLGTGTDGAVVPRQHPICPLRDRRTLRRSAFRGLCRLAIAPRKLRWCHTQRWLCAGERSAVRQLSSEHTRLEPDPCRSPPVILSATFPQWLPLG